MAIEVKLQVFEGPLDLLLHLIEKNKVDIYSARLRNNGRNCYKYSKEIAISC